jgi:hypothetical protein
MLAEVLEAKRFEVPATFKLTDWFSGKWKNGDRTFGTTGDEFLSDDGWVREVDPRTVECGVAACACGHAAMIPAFRAQGFMMVVADSETDAAPFFDGKSGWAAVRNFFDLTYWQSEHLFNSRRYMDDNMSGTPLQVAKRIRAGLKEWA